jgi:beta-catenin-like protein 1
VENTYEKADKLLEIRDAASGRLQEVDKDIAVEKRVSGIALKAGGMPHSIV